MNALPNTRKVDQNALQTNRFFVMAILMTAFVLNRWELVALAAFTSLLTTITPRFGPFVLVYRLILRPAGLVRPDERVDNAEANQFATLIGFIVASAATYLLLNGQPMIAWGLVWMMIVLAGLSFLGWCAGCFMYYVLNRLGLKGYFRHAPIAGTFPGVRPPKNGTVDSRQIGA